MERTPLLLIVEPCENIFILLGGYLLVLEFLPSSSGDQEKHMMGCGSKIDGQVENGRQFMTVLTGDRRVDLKFKPHFLGQPNASKGALKSTLDLSEMVMTFRGGSINAHTHPLNTGILHFPGDFFVHQGSIDCHNQSESLVTSMTSDLKDVFP